MPDSDVHDCTEWINPIGGYGDMLMVSGVLLQVHERDPHRRFNLVRRTNYLTMLKEHPAIASVGHPPHGAVFRRVDYWAMDELGEGVQRPYQILAREFGLQTPVEERLFLAGRVPHDDPMMDLIPWGESTVFISPASDSPRKVMAPGLWHDLVDLLRMEGHTVLQVGRMNDVHIRNAYSLLGLTTPHQLMPILSRSSAVITSDNFIMHAAHMLGLPAIVLWGATLHTVYGYSGHTHIQMPRGCDIDEHEECIGRKHSEGGKMYGTMCPENGRHCMNAMRPEEILAVVRRVLPSC